LPVKPWQITLVLRSMRMAMLQAQSFGTSTHGAVKHITLTVS
jgi:hypothetical protein